MSSNRVSYKNSNRRTGNVYSKTASKGYGSSKYSTYNRSYAAPKSGLNSGGYTRARMGNRSAREYGYYDGNFTSYNTSSVAHDYFYDTDIPVVKHSKRRVKRANEKEIIQLNMPKTIVSIAVMFTFSLALLCAYAVNSSYRGEISSKQAELAEIMEENQYLRTTLDDNIDLNKVAKEAEKLGLQKPQAYQITEVQVPNESYTVQYDAKIATQDKSIWEFVKSLLSR